MSQFLEGNHKAFKVGAALSQYARVKTPSGLVAAGVTDAELGVITRQTFASTDPPADVLLRTANGTSPMIASKSFSAGATVYTAASGQISDVQATGALKIGTALDASSGAGAVVEVLRQAYEA